MLTVNKLECTYLVGIEPTPPFLSTNRARRFTTEHFSQKWSTQKNQVEPYSSINIVRQHSSVSSYMYEINQNSFYIKWIFNISRIG